MPDYGWLPEYSAVVWSYGNNSIDGDVANEAAPTAVGLK
jgi:hypothetical protein